jgi:hypothetical protein
MTKIIITQLLIVLGCYVIDIIAIIFDLRSGIKKAKQRQEFRSSYGYRRTVEKAVKYFNFLVFGLLFDVLQITVCYLLREQVGANLPLIPFVSIVFAAGVLIIEIKSVYEKAEDKTKKEIKEAAITAKQVVKIIKDEGLLDKIESSSNSDNSNVNDIIK